MKKVEQVLVSPATTNQVHVLLVSFPGQGHVNPFLRLAKRIAAKGPLVTFSSSTDIGAKISSSSSSTTDTTPSSTAVPVGRGHLRLEFFPDDWTPGRHIMSHVRDSWLSAVSDLIRHQDPPVTAVVSDPFIPCLIDLAADMRIPCAILWIESVAVFSTYYHYQHQLVPFPTADCPDTAVTLPGLPQLQPDELPTFLLPFTPGLSLPFRDTILEQFKTLHKASWVLANTFDELERDAITAISKLVPVIPVGPLVGAGLAGPSGDFRKPADCMEWLEAQDKQSVVYVSVGSVVILSKKETAEVAHGLLLAGRPFIWVVREDCRDFLPEGFLEECGEKGMVVGWAPQESVLAHAAVGCFVTHCGWNSTLEALAAGTPVVALPQWGDQVTGAKFLAEVYGVGVRMKGEVGREEVRRCVEEVMVGAEIRRRAEEWKVAARAAVAEAGSSDLNVEAFVDEIRGRRCGCGGGVGNLAAGT